MQLPELKISFERRVGFDSINCCEEFPEVRRTERGQVSKICIGAGRVAVVLSQQQHCLFVEWLGAMRIDPRYSEEIVELGVVGGTFFVSGFRQAKQHLVFDFWRDGPGDFLEQFRSLPLSRSSRARKKAAGCPGLAPARRSQICSACGPPGTAAWPA